MPVAPPGEPLNGCRPARPPAPAPKTPTGDVRMSLLQRVLVAIANLVFALVFGRALGA
jgi:hypothetical protein